MAARSIPFAYSWLAQPGPPGYDPGTGPRGRRARATVSRPAGNSAVYPETPALATGLTGTPILRSAGDIYHPDQALNAASNPGRGAPLPRPRPRRAAGNLAADQDPHKIPTPNAAHRSHQHRNGTAMITYFCWSEARFASSRDRTRTYNLPVNRRSVPRGAICCCRSPSARLICINPRHGLTGPP
jgi:hypothetical protein